MEINERKNNRGMFYAIMGVATLVITIAGATFAYFVATTNSAVNAITTGSTTVSLTFDDNTNATGKSQVLATSGSTQAMHLVTDGSATSELMTGIKSSLVPVDTQTTPRAFAEGKYTDTLATDYRYAGAGQYDCRDANGNNICSVYSFTVTNPANVSQTIYPKFTVKNNGFTNLKYAVFKGTPAQINASTKQWDVNGSVVTTNMNKFGSDVKTNGGISFAETLSSTVVRKKVIGNPGDLVISAKSVGTAANYTESSKWKEVTGADTASGKDYADQSAAIKAIVTDWTRLEQILDPNESMTYTMIFWIEETYSNQSSGDMTKTFEAGVSFTTEGDGTGVTGNLVFTG